MDSATDGRAKGTPIVRVIAGSEPSMFTQHFRGWDADYLTKQIFMDPYEAKLQVRCTRNSEHNKCLALCPCI